MTEPIAWRYKNVNQKVWCVSQTKPDETAWGIIEPLYTAEPLPRRVKMTKKQLDAFIAWKSTEKLLSPVQLIWGVLELGDYPDEFDEHLSSETRDEKLLLSLANIWETIDVNNPEETIEIIPDMKWFVRSKEKYAPDMDQGISESGYLYLTQGDIYSIEYYDITTFKDEAQQFDTKEEAEKLTNPLTEAVQLPVEENLK